MNKLIMPLSLVTIIATSPTGFTQAGNDCKQHVTTIVNRIKQEGQMHRQGVVPVRTLMYPNILSQDEIDCRINGIEGETGLKVVFYEKVPTGSIYIIENPE